MTDHIVTDHQLSHSLDNVVGRLEAARIAGVTHQTIKNWADNGIIHTGDRPSVLARMNEGKSGRKHTCYYFRDEIEGMLVTNPGDDLISVEAAAEQLGVTRRTVLRLCERQGLDLFPGPRSVMYMRRADVDKQEPNVTYFPQSSTQREQDPTDDD